MPNHADTKERNILVTDPREIQAIGNHEIEGFEYADHEWWADVQSLATWRSERDEAA